MKQKSITVNAFLNTARTVLGIIFPLITFPYVSRVLQVEAVGIYNFSSSIVSYFVLIAALGIQTYAIREGTPKRHNKDEIEKFCSEIFTINMISTIISYTLLAFILLCIPKLHSYYLVILILSAQIIFSTIGVGWICNIYEDFTYITIRSIAVNILSLIFTFIFVRSENDLYKYVVIVSFANSASGVMNYFYIKRNYCNIEILITPNLKNHLKPILIIFSTSLAITIYVSSDTTMIGFFFTDKEVGLYSTSVKIYTIVKNVLSSVIAVLVPRFSLLFNSKEKDENKIYYAFSKTFSILTAIILPCIVGLYMTSRDVIYIIGGSSCTSAALSLKLLCFAILFSLYSATISQCIMIPNKNEMSVFIATMISAIVNIVLNLIFIPLFNYNGAAVTTIISEAIVFMMFVCKSYKYFNISDVCKDLFSIVLGCVFILIMCLISQHFINNILVRLLVSVLLSIIGYFTVLLALKNTFLINILKKILKK